ncbi:MAG: EAL domain-containing protein [Treponema sp.]|nr:EAL domain-containing protein [Treponema sp.]
MWNCSFEIPNLLITLTLLLYYFAHPRLPVKMNKAFLTILLVNIFTMVTDLIASVSLDYFSDGSIFYLKFINTLFFLLFNLRVFCFFLFTYNVLNFEKSNMLYINFFNILPFLFVQAIILLGITKGYIFTITPEGLYSKGPLYFLIYLSAFYYPILAILYILVSVKSVSRRVFYSGLIVNCILILGYICRILFPGHLIMNMFCLICIIVIYLNFEDPAIYMEGKTGLFNKHALSKVIDELGKDDNPMILGFMIHNYPELREIYSTAQTDSGIRLIGNYLQKTFNKEMIFYLHDGRFVIVGKDYTKIDSICKEISERFQSGWNADEDVDMYLHITFVKVSPKDAVKNKEIILGTLSSVLADTSIYEKENILIEEDEINKLEDYKLIKREVENSVEKNNVELYLQPIINTENNNLIGAEALARIKDSKGNIISPADFIPIAEKNGRINVLGQQIFEKTCKFIHDNDLERLGISWINVNLSPLQFLRSDLNSRYTEILKKYNVSADKIHFEITEESMIDDSLLQKQIKSMKESGFQFVLDDYGRGYSNVSRLKRCPFINIKLYMELVWDYFKDQDKILPTIVQTFKEMNFTVTAEGIENNEMALALKNIGCDYLQGYCFSKPLSAREFVKIYGT